MGETIDTMGGGKKKKAEPESSSDDDSSSEEEKPKKKAATKKRKRKESSSDDDSSSEEEKPKKKKSPVVKAAAAKADEEEGYWDEWGTWQEGKAPKKKPPAGERHTDKFKRELEENATYEDAFLKDNTYEGTFGADGWGAKASAILLQTKGKGFRHEKTKKKRGTYKGGKIDDFQVNSYKFQYSDSE